MFANETFNIKSQTEMVLLHEAENYFRSGNEPLSPMTQVFENGYTKY
jgi:hypothetical protein